MVRMLIGAAALAAPVTSLAHGAQAWVQIDNRFDGEAEVYVDGRYVGLVPGDGTVRFEAKPGNADVSVRRPGTGYVLASARLHLHPGAVAALPSASATPARSR